MSRICFVHVGMFELLCPACWSCMNMKLLVCHNSRLLPMHQLPKNLCAPCHSMTTAYQMTEGTEPSKLSLMLLSGNNFIDLQLQ